MARRWSIFEAAAAILLSRLYRRRAPRELLAAYRHYHRRTEHAPPHRRAARRARAPRRRPAPAAPSTISRPCSRASTGATSAGGLHRPRLGWSARTWRTQFGCFDPALDQIVHESLAGPRRSFPPTPWNTCSSTRCCTSSIPCARRACGIEAHSRKFREEEKRYAQYDRARKFLDRLP